MAIQISDRLRGIAVGAAVGDALGMPLEFEGASPLGKMIRGMVPGRLPAGTFTDDTEMALALAESLIETGKLDQDNLAAHFLAWFSCNPPDVGIHTSGVLDRMSAGDSWQTAVKEQQALYPQSMGNGSVMRCWPVAVAYWEDRGCVVEASRLQSQVTHAHEECTAACEFINLMLFELIHGTDPYTAFESARTAFTMPGDLYKTIQLAPTRKRQELRNTGWVRHTVESAVWGLLNTRNFEEALIQVINLGADSDTAGAVVGALAGAAYGIGAIPGDWRDTLRGEWPLNSGRILRFQNLIALSDQLAVRNTSAAPNTTVK